MKDFDEDTFLKDLEKQVMSGGDDIVLAEETDTTPDDSHQEEQGDTPEINAPDGADDAESSESSGTDEPAATLDTDDAEASVSDKDTGTADSEDDTPAVDDEVTVPIDLYAQSQTQVANALEKLAAAQAKVAALETQNTQMSSALKAEDIELQPTTELKPISDEQFQRIVDQDGLDEANQRVLERNALIRVAAQDQTENREAEMAEINSALQANPETAKWRAMHLAGKQIGDEGMSKPFMLMDEIEASLEQIPGETLQQRFARAIPLVKERLASESQSKLPEDVKLPNKPDAPTNLSDSKGPGLQNSAVQKLTAAGVEKGMEAYLNMDGADKERLLDELEDAWAWGEGSVD